MTDPKVSYLACFIHESKKACLTYIKAIAIIIGVVAVLYAIYLSWSYLCSGASVIYSTFATASGYIAGFLNIVFGALASVPWYYYVGAVIIGAPFAYAAAKCWWIRQDKEKTKEYLEQTCLFSFMSMGFFGFISLLNGITPSIFTIICGMFAVIFFGSLMILSPSEGSRDGPQI